MMLDEGSTVNSMMGSLCSLILLFLTLAYGYQKMEILINQKDVDVLQTVKDLFYTDDD